MQGAQATLRSGALRQHRLGVAPARHSRRTRLLAAPRAEGGGSDGERQPWDFGRFVRTLLWFNPPPSPGEVIKAVVEQPLKVVQALAGDSVEARKEAVLTLIQPTPSSAGGAMAAPAPGGVVLVAGATGGVGKRVVEQLLKRGQRVRALVRDVPKAEEMLGALPAAPGGSLELAAADVTQPRTLLPETFAGVRALVCCTGERRGRRRRAWAERRAPNGRAVRVQPKEGDEPDRRKYYQGIKFYDPEIVGDTPEAVEFKGLQNLVAAACEHLGLEAGKLDWGSLDDVVMGGASQSRFNVAPRGGEDGGPVGVFDGSVTTANNGGFASVRTRNLDPPLDLSAYGGLLLRVKGDGRRYKLILRTGGRSTEAGGGKGAAAEHPGWDTMGYTASFETTPGTWQTVRVPFEAFVPLMFSKFEYDGCLNPTFAPGPFELPLQSVAAYLPEPVTPRLVLVSSAGVTRPNRPGINIEEEPPAVRMNDMLGGILTYKLAGEDVVRASGVPHAIVRPVALTEEPRGAELQLDQGDTIRRARAFGVPACGRFDVLACGRFGVESGKISREDVAELCVELLSQPAGLDTTFEIRSTVPFSTPWEVDPAAPPPPRDWGALLLSAGLRQGVTGKTVGGVYTGKEPEAAAAAAAAAAR
eukprot:scaffold4.g4628.t1